MNDKWFDFAMRIQSIAQAGLQYGKDKFDKERYEELRRISAEMLSVKTDVSVEKITDLFCNESGYQTPKIDTRAAVFVDGKSLWCTKTMALGRSRAAGVMLINPLLQIPKRKYGKKQDLSFPLKK